MTRGRPDPKSKSRRSSNHALNHPNSRSDFHRPNPNLACWNNFDPARNPRVVNRLSAEETRRNSYRFGDVNVSGVYSAYLSSIENKKEKFRKLSVMVSSSSGEAQVARQLRWRVVHLVRKREGWKMGLRMKRSIEMEKETMRGAWVILENNNIILFNIK